MTSRCRLLAFLLAVVAAFSVAPAQAAQTSCGGTFTYTASCILEFSGFPITVEGSFTGEDGQPVEFHVEVMLRITTKTGLPPYLIAPGWTCQHTATTTASCSAAHDGPIESWPVPPTGYVNLHCSVHLHGPEDQPGSGTFRCLSGR